MKRHYIIVIAVFLMIASPFYAKNFSEVVEDEGQVSFYYQPKTIDYTHPIPNFLYTFKSNGTGCLMTGVTKSAFTDGTFEPNMSYYINWENNNDTLTVSLSIEDKIVARQHFRVSDNVDSIFQISEYPRMILISPWRISQEQLSNGEFNYP